MRAFNRAARAAIAATGLFGLLACDGTGSVDGEAPASLADLVVSDADFTFASTKTVRLEVETAEGEAVEVADADGRRVMDGAFLQGASIDLKVPVGNERLTVRTLRGDETVSRDVEIGADGRAVAGQ